MKKLVLLLSLIALPLFAQTTTNIVVTTVPVTNVVTTTTNVLFPGIGIGQIATDFLGFLRDAQPFYTNGPIRTAIGGVKIDKRWGGLIDIDVPVALDGQIGMGFAGLWLANPSQLYAGAVNLKAGTTWTPFGNIKINTWAASGPGYNNNKHSFILYSVMGATWNTRLGSGELSLSAGGVNISDVPGVGYFAAISYGWKL